MFLHFLCFPEACLPLRRHGGPPATFQFRAQEFKAMVQVVVRGRPGRLWWERQVWRRAVGFGSGITDGRQSISQRGVSVGVVGLEQKRLFEPFFSVPWGGPSLKRFRKFYQG